jgi:hypothetical protein
MRFEFLLFFGGQARPAAASPTAGISRNIFNSTAQEFSGASDAANSAEYRPTNFS